MSEPQYSCQECGRVVRVDPYARGFPPDAAKRKLSKLCRAEGHEATPVYRCGIDPRLEAYLREAGQL